jgi:uncharacterized membrane protein YphA (DoxX/SURF4 family)
MTVYTIFLYVGIAGLLLTALRFFFAKPANVLINFLQNFIGSLFIFSGFVKAIDPLGTSYKMHEYFEAMHMEFMNPMSTPFSVFMIVLELALGLAIILGWRPKLTAVLLLLMTLFFTLLTGFTYLSGYSPTLTFWGLFFLAVFGFAVAGIAERAFGRNAGLGLGVLALVLIFISVKFTHLSFAANFSETKMKVTDCGCFGDFIKLKPWETFWKDVFLDVLIVFLTINYKKISSLFTELPRAILVYGVTTVSLIFCLYNFMWNEPVIDFRPYKIGSDINEMRKVLKPEVKDYVFIYKNKKSGEEKEFKTAELSAITEDWEYKDRKDIVLDPGIPAKITNLYVFDQEHVDITDSLLNNPEYSLAVISYKLSKSCDCCFKDHLNDIAAKCDKAGIQFYAITSEDPEEFRHKHQCAYPFYMADETPLKTIMRSNPGLVLLKKGVVVNKWHRKHFPTYEELEKTYFSATKH